MVSRLCVKVLVLSLVSKGAKFIPLIEAQKLSKRESFVSRS